MNFCRHPHKISEIAKYEYYTVMKFLILEKQSANNFHERLTNVYGESAPLYATVTRWVAEFKHGWTSMEVDHSAERPVEVTTDDCCHAVEIPRLRFDLFDSCARYKFSSFIQYWWWEIDEWGPEDSQGSGYFAWQHPEYFTWSSRFKQSLRRWTPCFLTSFLKSFRVETCSKLLAIQCQLRQRVVLHCNWQWTKNPSLGSDTKQESMHWKHANSTPPRKFHIQLSTGKVMATILLDYKSVLLADYLPHKTTMTGPYYSKLLKKLCQAFTENWRGMLTRCPLLLHYNAPAHVSQVEQAV